MSRTLIKAYYALDDPMADLEVQPASLAWWRGLCRRCDRPTRRDLDFAELRGWHSRLMLCEVLADASDMVTRIVGEEVKDLFTGQVEPKPHLRFDRGTRLGTIIDVSPERQRAHVRRIVDTPAIAVTQGWLELLNGRQVGLFALDYPLFAAAGENRYVITFFEVQAGDALDAMPHKGLRDMACDNR
ncbi:hypothetical protein CCR85_06950 [Rhodothalassium salexigens]|uniref:hypothetical protein n=1 Tax=Rhodothalassium salexigens TaxID=1086 RepID=UPI001913D6E8|nr:hypothetical protein [Rhodothalassium salexigens]MBK5911230.1 hypothetical protein [Rhodothalassium salexigens]